MISISKNIIFFLNRQISDLKKKGLSELLRKFVILYRKLLIVFLTIISFPLVILIKFIEPIKKIRFGWFLGSRIGHFAFDVEYYLVKKYLENKSNTLDLFFYRWGKPANSYLAKLVEKKIIIKWWVEPLYHAHRILFNNESRIQPAIVQNESRDLNCLFSKVKNQLEFSQADQKIGKAFFDKIGIKNEKIICMVVRDSAYLKFSDYHNYRDCDIKNFNEAALFLAEKGYYVFRMGKKMNKSLTINHPRIIDYAFDENKSDFLDIWIIANCFFCISTGTGLDEIARIFRKPAVYVNYLPLLSLVSYDNVITTPKHLIWKNSKIKLTLSEHLLNSFDSMEDYIKKNIEVKELSPSEILCAVKEIESRLTGNYVDNEDDIELQNKFWNIFTSKNKDHKIRHKILHPKARIGSSFLKNNLEWLN
tara:strand:- start:23496 stop:24755 length:1260 start_codon:yes stop_codon:yes gene_type:complete